MPGNAALADVEPASVRVGDAGVALDAAGCTTGGTATFWVSRGCVPRPPPQPTASTATIDAIEAPVMHSRCQRLSRYVGLDT